MINAPDQKAAPSDRDMTNTNVPRTRTRATLADTVDALSMSARIGAVVFRAALKFYSVHTFVVFLCDPLTAFPLRGGREPGSSRLRLALERGGFGSVGRSMLDDALLAADIPTIDWSDCTINDECKPFRLPESALRALKRHVGDMQL